MRAIGNIRQFGVCGALLLAVSLSGASAFHQSNAAPNSEPNPYELVLGWAQLPPEIEWGQVSAFDFDAAGNVYVFHRNDPGILKFSPDGQLLGSWGNGLFVMAHGLRFGRDSIARRMPRIS